MNHSPTDDLPVLTEVVDENSDTLPVLTEVLEDARPAATEKEAAFTAPDALSALQARLEQLITEKLAARLAAVQQALLAEALAELKAELPELIRRARIPPRF